MKLVKLTPEVLTLKLFGKPQVSLGGAAVTGFISAKAQALLFYLAVTGRPHTREALAGLLWGEMPEAQAGKNLRNALSNLRTLAGPYLLITRDEVALNRESPYWLDVEVFLTALAGDLSKRALETLHNAVELYQGDFLEGFHVAEALALEEWMLGQRSLLKGLMVQALHTLVVKHLEREEYAAGIDYANRLLTLEPWREETHRHLMILLARSRQRSAALAQYEACRQVLAAELGVEPMPETTALYRRLTAAAAPPPHNLPPQPTAFVGREAELAETARYLNNPNAQLLTLVGPGGIGKTRLALQAAARCVEPEANVEPRFVDGVFFVPLAADSTLGAGGPQASLIAAMADALHFDFQGPVHPQAQLL
ncbi:MAG: BTAD domain-containing putative transcriptional regulator, partial [Anaerolineales bacterium]